ncbi:MAG: DUF2974 domain-containing protein [Eubacteriales bacterium]|nr:DUF2974 domain-containing protein [Eubacteriales bacterium]MDD4512686.1 DUF2974 domain-containing protein [Eubacteriales bacterium]
MPNILDYLKWRGDLTFDERPPCDVDHLVFAYIAYVNIERVFKENMTISEAAKAYFAKHTDAEINGDRSLIGRAPFVLKYAGESARFGALRLRHVISVVCEESEEQFAASTFVFPDGSVEIAYRGTDDSLTGWKEDLNMCFLMPVPAQLSALEYLDVIAERTTGSIHLTGHSKGGNLALYAAAKASPEIQKRIKAIYDLDGPGFPRPMLSSPGYLAVRDRVKAIVPKSSIIGLLMEHEQRLTIVSSSQTGVMQHDGLSWQVMGSSFVTEEKLDSSAENFSIFIQNWLSTMDTIERSALVDAVIYLMNATNSKTVSELTEKKISSMVAVSHAYLRMSPEDKKQLRTCMKVMFAATNDKRGQMLKDEGITSVE